MNVLLRVFMVFDFEAKIDLKEAREHQGEIGRLEEARRMLALEVSEVVLKLFFADLSEIVKVFQILKVV